MAIPEEIQIAETQEPCTSNASPPGDHRFDKLRGVRWRINLGILPSSPSSTIDELRRVTADSRRRFWLSLHFSPFINLRVCVSRNSDSNSDQFQIKKKKVVIFTCLFPRYAALRRRLLIDPHLPKKGINSPDLTIDNPLSQNPGKKTILVTEIYSIAMFSTQCGSNYIQVSELCV